MPEISQRAELMPASPIRKLVPLAEAARARGTKIYHLNIGQPDLPSPKEGLESLKHIDRKVLEYSLSDLASADRATVQERVAAGQPAADAEAEFLTDEYFDAWYGGICAALEKYAG